MLRVELQALAEDNFDLELLGVSDDEPEDLLQKPTEVTESQTNENAVPEQQPDAVTKPGDVWLFGRHRLLCGDATEFKSYEKLLAGLLPWSPGSPSPSYALSLCAV